MPWCRERLLVVVDMGKGGKWGQKNLRSGKMRELPPPIFEGKKSFFFGASAKLRHHLRPSLTIVIIIHSFVTGAIKAVSTLLCGQAKTVQRHIH